MCRLTPSDIPAIKRGGNVSKLGSEPPWNGTAAPQNFRKMWNRRPHNNKTNLMTKQNAVLPLRSEPGREGIHSLDEYALDNAWEVFLTLICTVRTFFSQVESACPKLRLEVITYATDASESPKSEVAFREDVAAIFHNTLDTFRHPCCLGSPAWTGIY